MKRPVCWRELLSRLLAPLVVLSLALPAAAGEWQFVGKMTEARWDMTATLLQDGTVLVTGGRKRGGVAMRTAERFDPQTNTFTAVGPMTTARHHFHMAALLQDGRVLVTGGDSQTADVFDPATNTFTRVGSTRGSQFLGSATLLANGQVLVAGGNPKIPAELFDPTTGRFQATGRTNFEGGGHAAVTLADGRVVFLGGFSPAGIPQRRVEVYDPATGAFTLQGQLVQDRWLSRGTLLPDGRILVSSGGGICIQGGECLPRRDEIYDPATGQSVLAQPEVAANGPRAEGGVAISLQDGRVLLAGGSWKYFTPTKTDADFPLSAELFDPATGKLTPTAPMLQRRGYPAAVRLADGRVLVMGGYGPGPGSTPTDTAEVYVP